MIDEPDEAELAARSIAEEIAKFRQEFWDNLMSELNNEVDEMERSGFDPTYGRGRGPKWAEGA